MKSDPTTLRGKQTISPIPGSWELTGSTAEAANQRIYGAETNKVGVWGLKSVFRDGKP